MLQHMAHWLRSVARLVAATALFPATAAAQTSGARQIVPITPVLFAQAEGERLVCVRQRADEQIAPRYPGRGIFEFALEGSLPLRWRITLVDSRRTVTLGLVRNYVPREIIIDAGRDAGTAALHEAVQARFLPDGRLRDGSRAVTAARRSAPVISPLDSADGARLYDIARELAFRCDRRILEPVPEGSILGQIPPG